MPSRPPAESYCDVFRASRVPSVVVDLSWQVVDLNPAFARMTGLVLAAVDGRSVVDLLRTNCSGPSDDSPFATAVATSLGRVVATGATDRLRDQPVGRLGADGSCEPRVWNVTTSPVTNAAGEVEFLLQEIDDVTTPVEQEREISPAGLRHGDGRRRPLDALLLPQADPSGTWNSPTRDDTDRSVAETLQRALLIKLPESTNLQLAARYLTPSGTEQVGGDWYDAYVAPNDDVTLTIGDVMGHDIVAAGLMSQLRNLLRALVVDRSERPAQLLSRLDHALQRLRVDTLATAALLAATPDPDGGWNLQWSNAGHPAPMLVGPDGSVELLDGARSLLLGVRPDAERADLTRHVQAGSMLLLYTDGLIETRDHDLDDGKARLALSAARHCDLSPHSLVDAVLADMVGDHPQDDVAVLAVRFASAPSKSSRAVPHPDPEST